MGIFAEELAEMDRNSADYMIDRLEREREKLLKEKKDFRVSQNRAGNRHRKRKER